MTDIRIDQITVVPGQNPRKTFSDQYIEELSESIRLVGLIHPIVLDENNTLISGECRLRAFKLLNRDTIPYLRFSDLDQWQKDLIQLEENIRRKDLNYIEELLAKLKIHRLMQQHYGKKKLTGRLSKNYKWTQKDTAQHLGISTGAASQELKLAEFLVRHPEFQDPKKYKTKSTLQSAIARFEEFKLRETLAQVRKDKHKQRVNNEKTTETGDSTKKTSSSKSRLVSFVHNEAILYNNSYKDVIPSLDDNSVDCLLTDPPWQVEADQDSLSDPRKGLQMAAEMLELLWPKLSPGALCWMFGASRHLLRGTLYRLINDLPKPVSYRVFEQFFIWYKPKQVKSNRPYEELKNDYEPCLVFSKGQARQFNYPIYAVYTCSNPGTKLHPHQKPLDLVEHLIQVSTLKNELILDPFMGSGTTILAASRLGRRSIGIDNQSKWFDLSISRLK